MNGLSRPTTLAAALIATVLLSWIPLASAQSDLYVGSNSSGDSSNFTDGSVYNYSNGYIGYSTNTNSLSSNNALTISSGALNLTGDFYVGTNGVGNSVTISGGGTLTVASNSILSADPLSSNNSILVTDSGTVWSNAGSLTLGGGGANSLSITNGAIVQAGDVFVGTSSNSNNVLSIGASTLLASTVTVEGQTTNANMITGSGTITAPGGVIIGPGGTLMPVGIDNATPLTINGPLTISTNGSYTWSIYGSGNVSDPIGRTFTAPLLLNGSLTVLTNVLSPARFDLNWSYQVRSVDPLWFSTDVVSFGAVMTNLASNSMAAATNLEVAVSTMTQQFQGFSTTNFFLTTSNNAVYLNYSNGQTIWNGSGDWNTSGNWTNGVISTNSMDARIDNGGAATLNGVGVAYNLAVGLYSSGNSLSITNGGNLVVGDGVNGGSTAIGDTADSSNNAVLVDGAGGSATWTNLSGLYVGYDGSSNSLVITNGGLVANWTGAVGFGARASSNSVIISGSGSIMTNSGDFYVGFYGSGNSVIVTNGGTLYNGGSTWDAANSLGAIIGGNTGADSNAVLVTGSNSAWIDASSMTIGSYCSQNSLTITNSSLVSVAGQTTIGNYGDSNSVLVTSNSSLLSTGGFILGSGSGDGSSGYNNFMTILGSSTLTGNNDTIGFYGNSNTLLIKDNSLYSNTSTLSVGVGASGNQIIVSNNSIVSYFGGLYLGYEGYSNSITIIDNSKIISGAGNVNYIGYFGNSNSLFIAGGGSLLSIDGYLYLGCNGFGNIVEIANMGKATVSSGTQVGDSGDSNYMLVSNNACLLNDGGFIVGNTGNSNSLTVSGSSTLTGYNDYVGFGGNGNTLTITGNSLYSNSGALYVGDGGTNNSVLVSGGSKALIAGDIFISYSSGDASNSILVTGEGSTLSNAGSLYVGYAGSGSLTIASGGSVFTPNLVIDGPSTNGTVNIGTYGGSDTNITLGAQTISFGAGNGTLNLNQADTFTLSNNLTQAGGGTGSVYQLGTGTTIFTGNNSYVGTTTVNAGVLQVDGTNSEGSTFTVNGGILRGLGRITAPVVINNGGTITPGHGTAPGTLTVGTFTLNAGGILNIFLSNAQTSVLEVTGNSTLAGTISFTALGASLTNQIYTFLTYSGSQSGTFASTNGVPSGYQLVYGTNNTDFLEKLPAPSYPSFLPYAMTYNQQQVALALDAWESHPTGDQTKVLAALTAMTNSPTQLEAALNAISPQFYQSLATIAFNLANALYNDLVEQMFGIRVAGENGGGFTMNGLPENMPVIQESDGKNPVSGKNPPKDILRPGADTHWGMFVDANGIFAQANSGNMLPTYNAQSGGLITALTYKWNPNVVTGIYAGYEGSYAKYGGYNSGNTVINNAVRFGLFGTYGQRNEKGEATGFYGDGLIGGAYNNYNVTRNIAFTGLNRTATSSPGAGELDSLLAAGYNWKKGNWSFGPVSSLQYTYFGMNSFSETGAQSLDLQGLNWNTASMIYNLGANCAYSWQANRDLMLVPQINLAWQHEFLQNPYNINGSLAGNSFVNTSSTPLRDTLYTGVGFTVEYRRNWHTGFFYNAAAGNQNMVSQNIFWSLGMKF